MGVVPAAGRRDERGSSALELALIAPFLLSLIFFSIQACLWWYGRTVALQSAREGVSQVRLAQDERTYLDIVKPAAEAATVRFASSVGREALVDAAAKSTYDGVTGQVSVTVTGHVMTLWPGPRLSVTQSAYGRIERFTADTGARP